MQRAVLTCRDVEGMCSEEVCDLLGISRANERVILHRARSKMRASLVDYIESAGQGPADSRRAGGPTTSSGRGAGSPAEVTK